MMWKIIITVLLFFTTDKAFTAERPFTIKGTIEGQSPFSFVYAFDNKYKLITAAKIENNTFLLKGNYSESQRFGQPAFINILLGDYDSSTVEVEVENLNLLSKRKHFNATIIAENEIEVIYNVESDRFYLKGTASNRLQNQFDDIYYSYRKSRDSIYKVLEQSGLNPKETEGKKVNSAKELFSAKVIDMMDLIASNPTSKISLLNFSPVIYDASTSGKSVLELFYKLSDSLKTSDYGQYVLKDIESKIKNESVLNSPVYIVGMKFPSFELPDSMGLKTTGAAIGSRYTLIDFWATWCGPCRAETPNLVITNTNYKARGFKVITISLDAEKDEQKWQSVLKTDKMEGFTNLFNGNDKIGLAKKLGIVAIPANYLIDKNGIIVAKDLRGDSLEKMLKTLLK